MTPHQISLVQKTWALAEPLGDTVTTLFYGRLFELDQPLRSLFKKDMMDQGRSLQVMLSMVTADPAQPDKLMPALAACGSRHLAYRVEDSLTTRCAKHWPGLARDFYRRGARGMDRDLRTDGGSHERSRCERGSRTSSLNNSLMQGWH